MWDFIKQQLYELKWGIALLILSKVVTDNLPDFHYKAVIRAIKVTFFYMKMYIAVLPMFFMAWYMKRNYDKLDPQTQGKVLLGVFVLMVCVYIEAISRSKELKKRIIIINQ